MDIHRCRFVPYPAAAINALAFSHPSPSKTSSKSQIEAHRSLRLAVGRSNGNIEIWNPQQGHWFQECVLLGGKDRSVEGLVWTRDPDDVDGRGSSIPGRLRLFSTGYSDVVTEWDIAAGQPLRHASSNHGEIWCMAAQPKDAAPQRKPDVNEEDYAVSVAQAKTQRIAVGCADGSIVILSTEDGDLRFEKMLARPGSKKPRVLSLAFKNRHTVVAGHADSTLRIYDIRSRQLIRNVSLGGGIQGGPKETLIWCVRCLPNGFIVTGDSTGIVSFFDGKHYSLLQRIKGHEADVLDLAVSKDGMSVFSGGMDRRTVLYQLSNGDFKMNRWAKISHDRQHKNDVKAMTTYEAPSISVLVSGGLDAWPMITPIQEFGKEHHRALPYIPQSSAITSAAQRRLMICYWERELNIWSIKTSQEEHRGRPSDSNIQDTEGRQLLSKMLLQGEESVSSVSIASKGNLLAVSTTAELKLFALRFKNGGLRVRRLPTSETVRSRGARDLVFSPDGRWLGLITPDSVVNILRVIDKSDETAQKAAYGTLGRYDRSINCIAFSSDSKVVIAGDLSGYLDSWVLEGHEDLTQENLTNGVSQNDASSTDSDSDTSSDTDTSDDEKKHPQVVFGQHWIRNPAAKSLPKLSAAPLVLSFRPSFEDRAPVLTNGTSTLHPTRHNPHPHSHDLPDGEDRLLVVTADNAVREFHVLTGKLTDWSRRNPSECLPEDYLQLRDRAKGVIWDIQGGKERIWLFGVSWLFMLDLSRNIPSNGIVPINLVHGPEVPDGSQNGARKRQKIAEGASSRRRERRLRLGTGAGSKIPDHMLKLGVGRQIRSIESNGDTDPKLITLNDNEGSASDGEGASEPSRDQNLLRLRRGEEAEEPAEDYHDTGDESWSADTDYERSERPDKQEVYRKRKRQGKSLPYWHTHKYRPILGIVPIGEGPSLEVALVERPDWEIDMPAKYQGNQERNP
ncbi:uncharacterized protein KY384_001815 [Bacidia gigantensis]|uniref:uncharacterized protein n=1 Tax=Bacidia gigantensis TaxID=2732470 RepID=UPI001D051A54|nr:uncharacterized protein KY384_001815 [Bacidia gigantensis]KAG8533032.1 hypothetical protein KY384_001815 [Bacidia gigantensis]